MKKGIKILCLISSLQFGLLLLSCKSKQGVAVLFEQKNQSITDVYEVKNHLNETVREDVRQFFQLSTDPHSPTIIYHIVDENLNLAKKEKSKDNFTQSIVPVLGVLGILAVSVVLYKGKANKGVANELPFTQKNADLSSVPSKTTNDIDLPSGKDSRLAKPRGRDTVYVAKEDITVQQLQEGFARNSGEAEVIVQGKNSQVEEFATSLNPKDVKKFSLNSVETIALVNTKKIKELVPLDRFIVDSNPLKTRLSQDGISTAREVSADGDCGFYSLWSVQRKGESLDEYHMRLNEPAARDDFIERLKDTIVSERRNFYKQNPTAFQTALAKRDADAPNPREIADATEFLNKHGLLDREGALLPRIELQRKIAQLPEMERIEVDDYFVEIPIDRKALQRHLGILEYDEAIKAAQYGPNRAADAIEQYLNEMKALKLDRNKSGATMDDENFPAIVKHFGEDIYIYNTGESNPPTLYRYFTDSTGLHSTTLSSPPPAGAIILINTGGHYSLGIKASSP